MFGSHQGCEAASPTPCSIRSLFLALRRIYLDFFFLPSKMDSQLLCVLIRWETTVVSASCRCCFAKGTNFESCFSLLFNSSVICLTVTKELSNLLTEIFFFLAPSSPSVASKSKWLPGSVTARAVKVSLRLSI